MDTSRYLEKSGDKRIYTELQTVDLGDSWFNYSIGFDGELVIVQAQGDHRKIAERARSMARGGRIIFATRRNGKAFARLTGAKIIGTVLELKS